MIATPGEPVFVFLRKYIPPSSTATITFTKANDEEVELTTARRVGDGVEFRIAASYMTAENLPATAELKLDGTTVQTINLEAAESTGGGSTPGADGRGITNITRTAGDGSAGTDDTYTITYTDGSTSSFTVHNGDDGTPGNPGAAGRGITSIARTSGTGAPGTTDVYTITYSDGSTSTYNVANGSVGTGSFYFPRDTLWNSSLSDITSVATGAAADGTLNEQYVLSGNALPTPWPVDVYGPYTTTGNTQTTKTSQTSVATVSTFRMMTDAPKIAFLVYANTFMADLFVDGKPYASNPITLGTTTGLAPYGFTVITFPSAKPRLVEWRSISGMAGVYVAKPYRVWKPAQEPNPKIAVVGDSYVAPTVLNDASSGSVTSGIYLRGIYQRMNALLGVSNIVTDGVGGSGYVVGGGTNLPYGHSSRLAWLTSANPDVVIVHGGGANDLNSGQTVSQTVTGAISYLQTVRSNLPKARIIFVEGFAPPGFTPATFNPNYTAVRQGVQAGVGISNIYYLDIATTRPPLNGSGYVTAANGTGNSDIYVGSDAVHLTVKGNEYVRNILAPKIRRVLADDGRLDGTLIL